MGYKLDKYRQLAIFAWWFLLLSQTMCSGRARDRASASFPTQSEPGQEQEAQQNQLDSEAQPDKPIQHDTSTDMNAPTLAASPRARLCLDPGHPSYPEDKLYEGILNRKVVHYLSDGLIKNGFAVLITANDLRKETLFDPDFDNESQIHQNRLRPVSLEDRIQACTLWRADFLISVHHNGGRTPKKNKAFVFYGMNDTLVPWHEESRLWAQMTAQKLEQTMEISDSRVESDQEKLGFSLGILRSRDFMSILTEASYYSIEEERKRLNTDEYLRGEAEAILQGFLKFFAQLEKKSVKNN